MAAVAGKVMASGTLPSPFRGDEDGRLSNSLVLTAPAPAPSARGLGKHAYVARSRENVENHSNWVRARRSTYTLGRNTSSHTAIKARNPSCVESACTAAITRSHHSSVQPRGVRFAFLHAYLARVRAGISTTRTSHPTTSPAPGEASPDAFPLTKRV
jgi:hypothetical protein